MQFKVVAFLALLNFLRICVTMDDFVPASTLNLTSRPDVCVSKVFFRHQQAFKSDLRFLLQSLMLGLSLKQVPQHGSLVLELLF